MGDQVYLMPTQTFPRVAVQNKLLAKTNPAQTIGSITTPNDGQTHLYIVFCSLNILVNNNAGNVQPQLVFTDENGNVNTLSLTFAAGTGFVSGTPALFLANPGTVVTVSSTGTLVGTFDIYMTVLQLN